ncbi:MAG: ankyrin repeat domain-containing protein [Comamonadaceae bacterium]|nr:ankyrin repeat domain-containing protein [Comamonadaceae bacterium]
MALEPRRTGGVLVRAGAGSGDRARCRPLRQRDRAGRHRHARGNGWAAGLAPDFLADRIGSGLMIAAWEGNIPMMQLFLDHGADINRVSPIGEQALQLAAWKGHPPGGALAPGPRRRHQPRSQAVECPALRRPGRSRRDRPTSFSSRGADVDARTPNDSTALMMTRKGGPRGPGPNAPGGGRRSEARSMTGATMR